MKISRFALVLSLLVLLLLMSTVAVSGQDVTELGVTWWGSQSRHDRTIEVIEMFEAEHPDIHITYEFVGWTDYWPKVTTQAAGGNMACVMQQDYKFMTEWAQRDLLYPLNDLLESGAIDVSNVSDSVIDSGRVDGDVYGISLGMNSQAFILDADLFEEAGIELPAWDWTWDDFEEISTQFHDTLGIWGMAYGIWEEANIKALLISSGQGLFNDDLTAIGVEDPSPVIQHLERMKRMMDAGSIASMEEQADVSAPGLEGSPIVTGGEAMRYQWSNQVVALYTAAGEDRNLVLYPLPRLVDGVTPNYLKPSMFFSITDGCETIDEAAMFIDYFTNSIEANDVLLAERGVPISTVILDHLAEMADPVNKQVFDFIAAIGEIAQPVPPPDPAGYTEINENVILPQLTDPVLFGMISAEEGWETFVREANIILEQNQ